MQISGGPTEIAQSIPLQNRVACYSEARSPGNSLALLSKTIPGALQGRDTWESRFAWHPLGHVHRGLIQMTLPTLCQEYSAGNP